MSMRIYSYITKVNWLLNKIDNKIDEIDIVFESKLERKTYKRILSLFIDKYKVSKNSFKKVLDDNNSSYIINKYIVSNLIVAKGYLKEIIYLNINLNNKNIIKEIINDISEIIYILDEKVQ